MEENENRKYDRIGRNAREARDDDDDNGGSIPSQIRELDELRKQGVLSDDEFKRKKQELLDRM
jgi:Short C-terminal domain